ncbi:MAG: HlyC/CorC family transporter [Bacteroidales bacterium]|nr:HlyC/CorC family transporter [Bacteroidales bacterium]MBN2757858.1 HlyC/CorC family transporter [Bacteroidales bacterium]
MNDTLFFILLTLIFSAFFSGMEIAFVSSNKLRIELDKKQGTFPSGIIAVFIKNPGQYISTMLVGNNIALVIYGILMAFELTPFLNYITSSETAILILQTIISTFIILVTAEFLPKTIFRINPNKVLNFFAVPLVFFYYLLFPVTKLTVIFSAFIMKVFFKVEINKTQEQIVFGKIDLDHIIDQSKQENRQDTEIEHDIKLFQNALDFSKIKLRECIVPRNELLAIEINESIEKLKQKFIETGYSKILIFEETIDNIIGYVQSSDLFQKPENINSMLKELLIVPETMPAHKLLNSFMKEHKSIALVVDEFGGTSGIVTIEDIMEEIFGEIEDEHDSIELIDEQINEHEFIFSGRIEIDYINEKYNLSIPESDDYETIAGFILTNHEEIPIEKDVIIIDKFEFEILNVDTPKIELLKLKVHKYY